MPPDHDSYIRQKAPRNDPQLRFAFFADTENHSGMQMTLATPATRLSTFTFQLIYRPLHNGLVGNERLDQLVDFFGETS